MSISKKVNEIVHKRAEGGLLTAEDIHILLAVEGHSIDAGYVLGAADEMNRSASGGKGEVHAQIGLNLASCPKNCGFCAFAAKNMVFSEKRELDVPTLIEIGRRAEQDGANALFIMATAEYPFEKFIEVSQELRSNIAADTMMITNVGDFDAQQGKKLQDAGYHGIYHAVRMGEGEETRIPVETRLATVRAAREAGLLVGTCVEPVGPEHSADEIVQKILIGRDMDPCYSGAMRRISIPGSDMEKHGMISEYRMAYLVAVVRLAMGPQVKGNCTHEPNILGAASGANLFWAEAGTNPRDTEADTAKGRGLDVAACRKMLTEMDYDLVNGPSLIYAA